jgi:hypothetical protein
MGSTLWLVLVLVVVIGIAVLITQRHLHRKKITAFRAFAGQRGWRYAELDNSLANSFIGTPFGKGFARQAKHVLAGEHRGRELVGFEYIYKERHGSGKNRRTVTYRHTVVALSTPSPRPTLQVSREGLGRKLLGLVGVRDLELESVEFNKTFLIRTEAEAAPGDHGGAPLGDADRVRVSRMSADKFAYDVLHPRMMEWMLGDQRAREMPFRFERSDLVTWDTGSIDLNRMMWMLDYLCDVLDRVPAFVWKP